MSEARRPTSIIGKRAAGIVVSILENARDRDVLARELNQNHAGTGQCLEEECGIVGPSLNAQPAAQPSH